MKHHVFTAIVLFAAAALTGGCGGGYLRSTVTKPDLNDTSISVLPTEVCAFLAKKPRPRLVLNVPEIVRKKDDTADERAIFAPKVGTGSVTSGDYNAKGEYRRKFFTALERELRDAGFEIRNVQTVPEGVAPATLLEPAKKSGAEIVLDLELETLQHPAPSYIAYKDANDKTGEKCTPAKDALRVTSNLLRARLTLTALGYKQVGCSLELNSPLYKADTAQPVPEPFYSTDGKVEFSADTDDTYASTFWATGYAFEIGAEYKPVLIWPAPSPDASARDFAKRLANIFKATVATLPAK